MNKYLEKVAARFKAKGKHYHKAKEIVQEELIERGFEAAKEHYHKHRHKSKEGHEKAAIALTMYEDPKTGKTKWVAGDKPGPEGWTVKKKSYKKSNVPKA